MARDFEALRLLSRKFAWDRRWRKRLCQAMGKISLYLDSCFRGIGMGSRSRSSGAFVPLRRVLKNTVFVLFSTALNHYQQRVHRLGAVRNERPSAPSSKEMMSPFHGIARPTSPLGGQVN